MRLVIGIIHVLLLSALVFMPASSQEMSDRDYRRWLSKKPIIKDIEILGNRSFTDSKFKGNLIKKGILFSKKNNWLKSIKANRRRKVQRETISRDTSAVKYLYLSNGFLNVSVNEYFVQVPPLTDSVPKAILKMTIIEGGQFKYNDISIEGDYPEKFIKKIGSITKRFKKGKVVNPFELRQAVYNIKSIFANNGYPYSRTDYSIDTTIGGILADVTFFVEKDSLVHFGEVRILGAEQYNASVVERELTFRPGDLYRRKDILKSQKRLLGTGYYITMRLESAVTDSSSEVERLHPDFILHLKEKKPHYVSIKTGAAQDTIPDLIWHLGISWGKRNFLGSRQLELSATSKFRIIESWALKDHSYRIRITEPWFLGIKMPLTLIGQFEPGVKSLIQFYRKQTWSVSALTMKTFGEKLKITAGVQYEQLNIYDVDTAKYGSDDDIEELIKNEEGISIRRKLYVNLIRDYRNSIFIPSSGSLTSFRFEYIGGFLGGGESFYVFEASWSRYQRIWQDLIYASRLKWGLVQEFGDALSVPIDDRFYIGGANTIRGFREKELGPATGSDIMLIANQELRFPLIGKFWSSFFCDIGNGFMKRSDIKFDNLAVTIGAGLQFISPAGPIRLDYAHQVQAKKIDTERNYRWHFTILYAF